MGKGSVSFLSWHFYRVPREILQGWGNFLVFIFHFFSVGLLLRSLLAPWKRQRLSQDSPGFNFQEWFQVTTFNLISRAIGGFIRTWFILVALFFELVVLVLGPLFLLVNLAVPLLSLITFRSAETSRRWRYLIEHAQVDPVPLVAEFLRSPRGLFLASRLAFPREKLIQLVTEKAPPASEAAVNFRLPAPATVSAVMVGLGQEWPPLAESLQELKLELSDLEAVLEWFDRDEEERLKRQRFWERENLLRRPGLGAGWSYGYTINLDRLSNELTKEQPFAAHLVGRGQDVSRMETILSRSGQSSVILVGEKGVGKGTVVFQLAENIRQGKVYPALKHDRVLEVNVNKVVGESPALVERQNKFEDILQEAAGAGNIILVIEDFDRFVATGPDRIDLTPVLDRCLKGGRVKVIGLTTPDLYQRYLFPNSVIATLFNRVEITPPDKQQAIEIAENYVGWLERARPVLVSYQAIREAVFKADRYIAEIPFPEKALELLDEVVVYVEKEGRQLATAADIDLVLSLKTKIPVGEITQDEKERLLNLEEVIHQRLINQEQAVKDLANAMRRARTRIGSTQKPLGVFLFLGPTGVGKTETAKALAEAYFGDEKKLSRLDMNEFQDEGASVRLLGDFRTEQPGIMTKLLRENPFYVLLLDELEKASQQVLNLLLTAFDEGYVTDNFGKRVSLQEMIIVCTSNAGAEFIRQKVLNNQPVGDFKKELLDYLLKAGVFSPEFINRFDSVVVYQPLTFEQLKRVAELLLQALNKRLKEKEISIRITPDLIAQVATQGHDPVFGARPMRRLIQDKIEAPLAQKILAGEIKKGEVVEFKLS